MKKFLVAVALLACAGGAAFAGPNAGGTIFAHDANLVYTVDTASYCGLGVAPSSCEAADVEIDGATDAVNMVWKVYAAFCPPPHASPRLKGMAFGIYLDDPIRITHSGNCVGGAFSMAVRGLILAGVTPGGTIHSYVVPPGPFIPVADLNRSGDESGARGPTRAATPESGFPLRGVDCYPPVARLGSPSAIDPGDRPLHRPRRPTR